MEHARVLSGIQPTSVIHLGNYLGAVHNWVALQEQYDECMYCVVDYHALTSPTVDPKGLQVQSIEVAKMLLACGIDAERSLLFIQSQVPEHTELGWILSCQTGYGDLQRMTQFKEKSDQIGREDLVSVGLFTYPVLQAADIMIYRATHVPVGEDQVQHIELCRRIARRYNQRFGDYFPETEAVLTAAPRIMSFRDPTKKMSSSLGDQHYLSLMATEDQVRKAVKKAVTDVGPDDGNGGGMGPGVGNMFAILHGVGATDAAKSLEADYQAGSLRYGDLKNETADAIWNAIAPIQERFNSLDEKTVHDALEAGAGKARALARETIDHVRETVGLWAG